MSFEIAKAGWLHRQTSVLKRWKRSWFVLYTDGYLKFFENPNKPVAEEAARMSTECLKIICGLDLFDVNPPDNMTRNCLFQLKFRDKAWSLCAESMDDMRAWQLALEQARIVGGPDARPLQPSGAPPPYTPAGQTYPAPQAYPAPQTYPTQQAYPRGTQVVYPTQGTTTVIQGGSRYPVQTTATAYPGQVHYGSHPPQYVLPPNQAGNTVVYVNGQPQYRRRYDGTDVAMGVVAGAAIGSMMWGPMLWW